MIRNAKRNTFIYPISFTLALILFIFLAIIPSIIRIVEAKRFEEDVAQAAMLTNLVNEKIDPVFESGYGAYDIKQMIRETFGTDYSFQTKSRHSGFFFDAYSNTIRVHHFSDFDQNARTPDLMANRSRSILTPEEPFFDGLFYLADEESYLSRTIEHIRGFAERLEIVDDYDEYREALPNKVPRFLHDLYGLGLSNGEHQAIESLLDAFEPNHVLWVEDSSWHTKALQPSDINRLLYSEGITTIPAFNLSWDTETQESITVPVLSLPRTVKTVEPQAFSNTHFEVDQMMIHSINHLYVQKDGFTGVKEVTRDIPFFNEAGLDFTPYTNFKYTNQGVEFDFSDHPNLIFENAITGYQSTVSNHILFIRFFSNDECVGHATSAYVTEYYLSASDVYPYYTRIANNAMFYEPPVPSGLHDFSGWYLENDALVEKDDLLETAYTKVYAK